MFYRCGGGTAAERHFATLLVLTEDEGLVDKECEIWLDDTLISTKPFPSSGVINFKIYDVGIYTIKVPSVEKFIPVDVIITSDDVVDNNFIETEVAIIPVLPPKVIGHIFTIGDYRYMVIGFDENSVRVTALHRLPQMNITEAFDYATGDNEYRQALSTKWNATNHSPRYVTSDGYWDCHDYVSDWNTIVPDYYNCFISYAETLAGVGSWARNEMYTLLSKAMDIVSTTSIMFMTGTNHGSANRSSFYRFDGSSRTTWFTTQLDCACPCFVLTRKEA